MKSSHKADDNFNKPTFYHNKAEALLKENPPEKDLQLSYFNIPQLINEIELNRVELGLVYEEMSFQNIEKGKRADELNLANIELFYQNKEKGKRADELNIANIEKFVREKVNEELRELTIKLQSGKEELLSSNELLKQKIEEVKKLNAELRDVSTHSLIAIEKERSAIAKEIHDELSQNLVALTMNASYLKSKLEKIENIKILDEQVEITNGLVETSRTLFNLLHPSMLDEIGLEAAIKWYSKTRLKFSNIQYKIQSNITEEGLPKDIRLSFFRIFQEAVTNILRYSKANNVDVEIRKENKKLIMLVHDDGVGFDASAVDYKQHHGLLTIRERMYAISGKFEIDSAIGKGTTLKIEADIP